MHAFPAWNVDATQILSRSELAQVLADLRRRAQRLPNVQMNLAIVRLACCCGLRASEIGGLRLADVVVRVPRPYLAIRAEAAKLRRPRRIPLWWDAGTLEDLANWKDRRQSQRANATEPLVCSVQRAPLGSTVNRHVLRRRFLTARRVFGWDRLRTLTIHHGRHTFISHALAGGRTLAEVRAAAGHTSLAKRASISTLPWTTASQVASFSSADPHPARYALGIRVTAPNCRLGRCLR